MAFNKSPAAVMPSYSSDGTNITIPIASLAGLTLATADPATGDSRMVTMSVLDSMINYINAQSSANKPTKMFIKRDTLEVAGSGIIKRIYQVTITMSGTLEIAPE